MTYSPDAGSVRHEQVGRDLIVERTRAALRDRPMVDLQRQEIATLARVTPALISYYFPDRASLFEAAARPVIEAYGDEMRRILASTGEIDVKLKALVRLFLSFNTNEGHLLAFFLAHAKQHDDGVDGLDLVFGEAADFFEDMLKSGFLRGTSHDTLREMLWGLCRHVAARLRDPRQDIGEDVIAAKAEAIYDCFVNGAASLGPTQQVASAA